MNLNHNLDSINQLNDKGLDIKICSNKCLIILNGKTILYGMRINNIYMLNLSCIDVSNHVFHLIIIIDES